MSLKLPVDLVICYSCLLRPADRSRSIAVDSKHGKPKPAAPLVIPALPNKDWRKAAEELRAGRNSGKKREMYLPERGGGMRMRESDAPNGTHAPPVSADVDAINTEEVVGGLERREKKIKQEAEENGAAAPTRVETPPQTTPLPARTEETEEQRAMRELMGEAGGAVKTEEAELEAIYSAADARNGPIEEADAFKRDVDSRPDEVRSSSAFIRCRAASDRKCLVRRPLSKIMLVFPLAPSDSQC